MGVIRAEENVSDRPYWWQFLWIGLGMVVYTSCRVGFPVGLNAMGKDLHFSAFQASVLGTMFLLGQAIIDIPAGYWVDRFDRKRVLITGLVGLGSFGGQSIVARVLHAHAGAWQLALYWLGGIAMGYGVISSFLFQRKYL